MYLDYILEADKKRFLARKRYSGKFAKCPDCKEIFATSMIYMKKNIDLLLKVIRMSLKKKIVKNSE